MNESSCIRYEHVMIVDHGSIDYLLLKGCLHYSKWQKLAQKYTDLIYRFYIYYVGKRE